MNGNNISSNSEFDQYLKRFGYKFKNENKEIGGYAILYNKKIYRLPHSQLEISKSN